MKINETELAEYNVEVTSITALINDIINDIVEYHKENSIPYNDDKFIMYDDIYNNNNSYFLTINNDGNYILNCNKIGKNLRDGYINNYGYVEVLTIEQMGIKIYNYYVTIYDEYVELLNETDFDEVAKYDVDYLNLIFERIDEIDNIITNNTKENIEYLKTKFYDV